jgi:hypothetical protein
MNTFLAVFNAFPAILGAVQAAETAVPLPQKGQQKLNLVLGAAACAWDIGQIEQQISKSNMLSSVLAITNVTVAGLNAAGVFTQSAPVSSN